MRVFFAVGLLTITILVSWINSDYKSRTDQKFFDDEQTGLNEQIVIRFSHVVAENTPKGLAAQKFADLVEKYTKDKVKVEVFPNEALYSDTEEIEALIRGDVQMIAPTFTKMTALVPEWKVLDLPFLFEDSNHVNRVFNGKVGKELIDLLDEKHMKGLSFWNNGFKQMTSNKKALLAPEDFKGQTFRVMPGEIIEKQFRLLGANPTPQTFNSVYRSLEMQNIDGQENTISNIYSKGLFKVQSHLTISNHGYLGYSVIINKDFWDKLSPPIKNQINRAMTETTTWLQRESEKMNEDQLNLIKEHSYIHIYTLTEGQRGAWKKRLLPLYKEVQSEQEKSLINKIVQARGHDNAR